MSVSLGHRRESFLAPSCEFPENPPCFASPSPRGPRPHPTPPRSSPRTGPRAATHQGQPASGPPAEPPTACQGLPVGAGSPGSIGPSHPGRARPRPAWAAPRAVQADHHMQSIAPATDNRPDQHIRSVRTPTRRPAGPASAPTPTPPRTSTDTPADAHRHRHGHPPNTPRSPSCRPSRRRSRGPAPSPVPSAHPRPAPPPRVPRTVTP